MDFRLQIRFQSWVLMMTVLLVLSLAAAFLFTVMRTFTAISEDSAQERFSLIAEQASVELESLVQTSAKQVLVRAGADRSIYVKDGALNPTGVVPTFLGSAGVSPDVYSHFFALDNDDFLQVINVAGDARIQAALQAPDGTFFAVRRITHDKKGERVDTYSFLSKSKEPLGQRAQPAKLVPTQRPWYQGAATQGGLFVTEPYVFASTGELGLTVAAPLAAGGGVLATDISLRAMETFLARLKLPANGAIAIQDAAGHVLAFHGRGSRFEGLKIAPMTAAEQLDNVFVSVLRASANSASAIEPMGQDGERFVVNHKTVVVAEGASFRVTIWAPVTDFTAAFSKAQKDVMLLSLVVLLVLVPLALLGSSQISRTLTAMAADSERLKQLDFSQQPHQTRSMLYEVQTLGEAQSVMHAAIQRRTGELKTAQDKLARLVDTGIQLSREQNRERLLRQALFGAREISHCAAATLFLKTPQNTLSFAQRTSEDALPAFEIPLFDAAGKSNNQFVVVNVSNTARSVIIDDVYAETRFDMSGTKKFSEESGFKTISMLTVPLSPRAGEVIGVIQLLNAQDPDTGAIIPFPEDLIGFVEALAAQAAVAIENQNLIEAQKDLMDALIKLIAGAIDAKSPYTGGHCERVPELGLMLAEAATAQTEGPLANFKFETEDEWREFRIGAWLHDCGKVTTPEYVVDKASKLETIYNRIHEVRTRFEVLLRDARISQLEALAAGADAHAVQAAFEARYAQLQDDFAFVAECNQGGEFMAPDKVERLQRIATETWTRHFDDRLGLAHEELKRYPESPETLPVLEALLSDKPQHIIPRLDKRVADPKWNFKVSVPEHLYNYGELYNLRISRGTLTEEERFKINEHVMQSLIMLEQLPLPKNLQRVPEYAGTHHETLVGTGYPRRLSAEALSVPMRIMAIADIFEALTASDRPYKKPKTLSECVKILSFFKKDGHIDPHLFDLFLSSGIYLRYAQRFLKPEQIDTVDIAKFISA
jgi:HD-GYP domain-containing protein (c-di-GMP phosphodiesterase class II)